MIDKWATLKYFKPNSSDNWGDPEKINPELLLKLDDFRAFIGVPIIVTSGTGGIHAVEGEHPKGNAVDIIIPNFKGNLFDLYLTAERFNFNGIGLYRDWKYYNRTIGGLHLDVRALGRQVDGTYQYLTSRWLGVEEPGAISNKQIYVDFNLENLKKHGFLE